MYEFQGNALSANSTCYTTRYMPVVMKNSIHELGDKCSCKGTAQAAAYLVAVGVGGGPVAQLGSRPVGNVGSAAGAHTSVSPGRGGKVGLAASTHHTHPCSIRGPLPGMQHKPAK